MKGIKRILKQCDFFGVPFAFKYRGEDTFTTSLGGLFFIIYILVVIVMGIYYFIPFINRKNFSIVYYSMNLSQTEAVKLKDSKQAFAVGFDCDVGKDGTKPEDILKFNTRFYTYTKDKQGKRTKKSVNLDTHFCNYADFYNNYNDSIDMLNIGQLQCLDKTDDVIQGIFTDEKFTYYELSVESKEETVENYKRIDDYLTDSDCKFAIYYSDITIDIDDYEDPIKPLLNELFIQLDPTLFAKMNIFFLNQYFENDDLLFSVFNEEEPLLKTSYSRVEQYSLYKGLNRLEQEPRNHQYYAKTYIRADTKKTVIKRKYQKAMEFYADASSLLLGLLSVITYIFNFVNNFYAENSLSRKLFFIRGTEDNIINIKKRIRQAKQLIDLTDPKTLIPSTNLVPIKPNDKISRNTLKKEEDEEEQKKEEINQIRIFKKRNTGQIKEKGVKEQVESFVIEKIDDNHEISTKKAIQIHQKGKNKIKNNNYNISNKKKKSLNFKPNEADSQKNKVIDISSGIRLNEFMSNLPKPTMSGEEQKEEKINYTYNIFEIIISSFLCCCMCKNLKKKKKITEQSNIILYDKLDIVLFIKNMILLDIMNETLINSNNKRANIIKFLSRPVISAYNKEENKEDGVADYKEKDFDDFFNESLDLIRKTEKSEMEKKLITLSHFQLKKLLYN